MKTKLVVGILAMFLVGCSSTSPTSVQQDLFSALQYAPKNTLLIDIKDNIIARTRYDENKGKDAIEVFDFSPTMGGLPTPSMITKSYMTGIKKIIPPGYPCYQYYVEKFGANQLLLEDDLPRPTFCS